jgi:predicted nucleotidyltransferase
MATSDAALRDLPDVVARVLDDFVAAAREAFADDLVAIVLFGSAAEGALRATSDVNVLVILRAFDRARADAVRGALRVAQAAAGVRAMFLRRDELEAASAAFAQKFADLKRRHRVLWGEDLVARLVVPRTAVIARGNQVLLNLALRLRAHYVERSLRDEQLVAVVAEAAAPLRTVAATIVELESASVVTPKEALRRLAPALGAPDWQTTLARMSEARETRALPPGAAGETTLALADLAERLRARLAPLG